MYNDHKTEKWREKGKLAREVGDDYQGKAC